MQTFSGVHHVFLPHKHLLNQAVKNVDQSQHTFRSGKCILMDLEKFHVSSSRKDQKGLKRWRPYTFMTLMISELSELMCLPTRDCPHNLIEKITSEVWFANGSRLYYETIKCKKIFCLFSSVTTYWTPMLPHPQNNIFSNDICPSINKEKYTTYWRLSPKYSCPELTLSSLYPNLYICV